MQDFASSFKSHRKGNAEKRPVNITVLVFQINVDIIFAGIVSASVQNQPTGCHRAPCN